MPGQLQIAGEDGPVRCRICGAEAAGPCARCRRPICADCGVFAEGSAGAWVICVGCERRGGRSLRPAWFGLLFWLLVPLAALAVIAVALHYLGGWIH